MFNEGFSCLIVEVVVALSFQHFGSRLVFKQILKENYLTLFSGISLQLEILIESVECLDYLVVPRQLLNHLAAYLVHRCF